jgi:hypothetical protein
MIFELGDNSSLSRCNFCGQFAEIPFDMQVEDVFEVLTDLIRLEAIDI